MDGHRPYRLNNNSSISIILHVVTPPGFFGFGRGRGGASVSLCYCYCWTTRVDSKWKWTATEDRIGSV